MDVLAPVEKLVGAALRDVGGTSDALHRRAINTLHEYADHPRAARIIVDEVDRGSHIAHHLPVGIADTARRALSAVDLQPIQTRGKIHVCSYKDLTKWQRNEYNRRHQRRTRRSGAYIHAPSGNRCGDYATLSDSGDSLEVIESFLAGVDGPVTETELGSLDLVDDFADLAVSRDPIDEALGAVSDSVETLATQVGSHAHSSKLAKCATCLKPAVLNKKHLCTTCAKFKSKQK